MYLQLCIVFVVFLLHTCLCGVLPRNYTIEQYLNNPSIQRFRRYVQIDSSKGENLEEAVEFWRKEASALNLTFKVHRPAGKPICVITWPGQDPSRPSIMLNSHMDVVPVEAEFWNHPPFDAVIDENGDLFGRGTQDDKDVAIQYLEAIRKLKEKNITLKRTLHMTLMPDEETGGSRGMKVFVNTKEFADLKVGFALDEGLTSVDDTLYFTYLDKRPWQIRITVNGEEGHSSTLLANTALQKIQRVLNEIIKYREEQGKIMAAVDKNDYGAYDTVNVNIIHGDIAVNVVPAKMYLVVDMRWAIHRSVKEMDQVVNSWISAAGNGTKVEFIRRIENTTAVTLDDSNIYWEVIKQTATEMGITVKPTVCPAVSDMIYIRSEGIPALGFAAKAYTINRMHGSNEYLNAATFLMGIDIYTKLLQNLGDL